MPKMKSCKAIAKRVKLTASGKLKHYGIGRRHLLSSKKAKKKRHSRKPGLISKPETKKIRLALAKG